MSQRQHRPSLLELCGYSKIKPKNKNRPSKQKAELKIFSVEKNHRKLNCIKVSSLLAESARLTVLLLQNCPNTGANFYRGAGVTTDKVDHPKIKSKEGKISQQCKSRVTTSVTELVGQCILFLIRTGCPGGRKAEIPMQLRRMGWMQAWNVFRACWHAEQNQGPQARSLLTQPFSWTRQLHTNKPNQSTWICWNAAGCTVCLPVPAMLPPSPPPKPWQQCRTMQAVQTGIHQLGSTAPFT